MLSISDTKIEEVLPFFSNKGIDVALLVPTITGINKSIMDATTPVRQFLLRNEIHDYDIQEQGQDNKVQYPAFFVTSDGLVESIASLYRPMTKSGDPRIWFTGLKRYCNPQNLLGVVTNGKALFVYNLSDLTIINAIQSDGIAAKVLNDISVIANMVADELLSKLKIIHRMGFVDTVTRGDTGIGMTLECLLGIPPNADKAPDYKGIEIKATRKRIGAQNRVNLFSQVPNWKKSKLSAQEILDTYGYIVDGRRQLYVTVNAANPNPQGLYFLVDENVDTLFNKSKQSDTATPKDVALWELESLRNRLNEKHRETFWVKATNRVESDIEQFRFDSVVHTRKPNAHLMGALLEQSIITMDYTLSQKATRVRDHGYLFKIKPENVELLFPNPVNYELSS
jgi:hypothetical protein